MDLPGLLLEGRDFIYHINFIGRHSAPEESEGKK